MLDLREWIDRVGRMGLLKEIEGADLDLEIGTITDLNAKMKKYTLMFSDFKDMDTNIRLLTGTLLDSNRVAMAFSFPSGLSDLDLVKRFKNGMRNIQNTDLSHFAPEEVPYAPLFENIVERREVDMTKIPAPRWHEKDGGKYIGTADAVITKDPDSDWINVGTYRIMVQGPDKLGMLAIPGHHGARHIKKYLDNGEKAPIAVSFGHHPLIFALGGLEIPTGVSEYNVAGVLSGKKYSIVKGPVTGLPIPADSELAIEGYVTGELMDEGPFGEFMGYYAGGKSPQPVINVEAMYYRNDPIILGTSPGKPPYDYSYFRCPIRSALIWQSLEDAGVPDVRGVWCHEPAYSRGFNVVSIKQDFAGHDRQAGYIAAQCRAAAWGGRFTIIVDEDINPTDINEVIWAMASRTDPSSSVDILRNLWGTPLDPTTVSQIGKPPDEITSSQILIFSTKSYSSLKNNTFPDVVTPSDKLLGKTKEKWKYLFSN